VWVTFAHFWSKRKQCARQDLELEVFLFMQSVGAALDHADLVVQTFDEPEGDFVSG
jgi:hypothetical protein